MMSNDLMFVDGMLSDARVGEHVVKFELRLLQDAVEVTATSDSGGSSTGRLTLPHKHDHSEELFIRDIKQFAWRLAEEAAGRGQAKKLVEKVFGKNQEENSDANS